MTRKNQSYSKEFKAEAIKTVLKQRLSISKGPPCYDLAQR